MKLRLPNKLQAALIAAIATVGFTLPQTEASTADTTLTTTLTTTFANCNQTSATSVTLANAFADVQVATIPGAAVASLTKHTDSTSTVTIMNTASHSASADATFFSPNINVGNNDSWKLTLNYTNAGDIQSINGMTLSVGLFTSGGDWQTSGASWNSGNETFTATVTANGVSKSYTGNLFAEGQAHKGQGSDKFAVTLAGDVLDLSSATDFSVVIDLPDRTLQSGCYVGLQNIGYSVTATVPASPIWQGTDGSHSWVAANFNPEFADGKNVIFGEAGYKTVTVDQAVTAGAVTVSGQGYTFNLTDGGNLTASSLTVTSDSLSLTGAGTVAAGSISASGKTINIGQDVVLQGDSTAAATLAGAGTYVLPTNVAAMGSIQLGGDWAGVVSISGYSFANDMNKLNDLRNTNSWVKLVGVHGWTNTTSIAANLILGQDADGWAYYQDNGNNNQVMTFNGLIAGSGKMGRSNTVGQHQTYVFTNNISEWDGSFEARSADDRSTTLRLQNNATEVNASIMRMSGVFYLDVQTSATFNKDVMATSLTLAANKKATFNAATNFTNGVTLNSESTLVNTGAMTLGGTIVFSENSIQNNGSGTVDFGSNIHFNITSLTPGGEGGNVYTLFTGNDVDLSGFNTNNITVAGGTAGKEWTFHENGTITFQLSRSVDWNNGAGTGLWNYTDANWSDNRQFQPNMVANFFTNAEATVSENVVAGGIVVGQADAEAPTVVISAESGSTLTAGSLDVVKGTLTTNTALLGLENVNIASDTTWNINADQTLGAGTYAGAISVGAGHTVTLNDAGNASSLLKGISGTGNITLTVNTDLEGTTDAANPVRTQAGGTLTIDGARLRVGYLTTDSQYIKKYVDMTSFDEVELKNNATLWLQAHQSEFNDVKVSSNSTIHIEDSEGRGTSNVDTLKVTGTMTLNANLTLETRWKGKVNIAALAGTGQLTLTGNELVSLGGGTVGSLKLDNNNTQTIVTGDLTVSSGDLTLSHGTLDVAGSVTVNKTLDLSVGGGSNATLNIKSGGTVTLANTGNASFWGDDGSHLNLEEGGTLALDKYGLSITGLAGGGSITFPNNTQYGIGKDGVTITGANVTVTAAGTGAVTIGNKLTNSKLTTGSHAVTLSHAEDSLIGLTISNGGSFTLNNTNLVDIANVQIENGGTLVVGAANLLGDAYTVTEGATVDLQGHRHTMTTLTLNGGTATTTHSGNNGAISGTIAINAGGTFKVIGEHDAFGYDSGVCTTKIVMQGEDSNLATLALNQNTNNSVTMRTDIEMNGYSAITTTKNGFNTWNGNITVTGIENTIEKFQIRTNATINVVGAADTLSVGVMALGSDSGKELTKTGAGTLTFTESAAANKLTINEGTVVMEGNASLGALVIAADGTLQVAGGTTTVSGGTNAINKALEIGAEGTLSLTAGSYALDGLAVQGYTQEYVGDEGQTIPTGSGFLRTSGTVQVANILSGGALNIGTDATFTHNGTAVEVATDTGIGTLTGDVNYSALYVNNGTPVSYAAAQAIAQAQPGSPTVDSVHLTVDGATINMDAAATIGLAIADNATGTVNATADTSISGITGAPAKLIVTGDSVVTLTSANADLTAAVEIDGTATLKMGNAGALGNTSGVTVRTGATLDVNGAKNQDTCISVTLAGGKLANTGNEASYGSKQLVNTLVVANNSIVDAQSNDFGLVSGGFAESTLTLNATLEKIGSYDFHLANTTVTGEGAIKATEGAVWFGRADAAAIGSFASNFIMNGGNVKGRLALADNITVTTVANGGTFSANVTNNGHTITFDGAGDLTISGVISGTGSLIKEGDGILTLNGTQTYTGDTVVKGGKLDIQGSISADSKVKVEKSAAIAGNTENITLGIAAGKTAVFTDEKGYTPKDSNVTFTNKGGYVTVLNKGETETVYGIDEAEMVVYAQRMVVDSTASQDVQVDNVLAVHEIENDGPVSLKLTSVVGETLESVTAVGDIEIDNLDANQRLRMLTIASGVDVTFLQTPETPGAVAKEATVTIGEIAGPGMLIAGGGTLHANLVLSQSSIWDLDGGFMYLGSQLTLQDNIQLDADTIRALDLMEIGETHWMVNAADGTQIDYDDADVWYDSKFVRDAYDGGASLEGDFIIVQNNDGTKWGLKKVSDTPEPTTGTLSLLALCALAARRRRK